MVAYLKATNNEKTYSDYLWAVWEAEEEERVETSCNSATANTSKLRAATFFPLLKLKGSQLAITPSAWMEHLEEKCANEEEGINGEDLDGIEGMTKVFIVCLARAVKDAQQMEKHCYHCDSADHFICDCPWLAEMKVDVPLNWKEGMVLRKGGWTPQGKIAALKGAPGWDAQGVKCQAWTPFLNTDPLTDGMGSKM